MSSTVLSIEPPELVQWYENDAIKKTLIVDVREHDYTVNQDVQVFHSYYKGRQNNGKRPFSVS